MIISNLNYVEIVSQENIVEGGALSIASILNDVNVLESININRADAISAGFFNGPTTAVAVLGSANTLFG